MNAFAVRVACASWVFLATLTAACGGGGGGGGGGGTGALTYSGNTAPAAITTTNASALTASVLSDELGTAVTGSLSVAARGPAPVSRRGVAVARQLDRTVRRIQLQPAPHEDARSAAIPVNVTRPCDTGGSVQVSGTLQDNGTGCWPRTW